MGKQSRLLEKALLEVNKCNPNSTDFICKFLGFYKYFKEICPPRGYNLGSPYARPDRYTGPYDTRKKAFRLRQILP